MGDGDFVQLEQTLRLGQALTDEHGIEALEIGEHDKLLQRGVVANVALGVGMGIVPLPRGLAEEASAIRGTLTPESADSAERESGNP